MKLQNMFKKNRKSYIPLKSERPEVPEGLLKKCNKCGAAILTEEVKSAGYICPKCQGYFQMCIRDRSSIHPIYGGTGSGAMSEEQCISLIQGLENAGYEVNSKLQDFYHDFRDERPHGSLLLREIGQTKGDWTVPEPTIEEYEEAGIFEQAKEFSDTAMIFIARSGGEAGDLPMNITASGEMCIRDRCYTKN